MPLLTLVIMCVFPGRSFVSNRSEFRMAGSGGRNSRWDGCAYVELALKWRAHLYYSQPLIRPVWPDANS
jgi:hypothetical protein